MLKAGERLDELRHGGMKLIQSAASPCFALDALLLADFVRLPAGARAIELGTGTGVISLLLAHKHPDCHILGLELMPPLAEMARRSVELNRLEGQVEIRRGDIRRAGAELGKAGFDAVISNPPYFRVGAGRANRDELDAAARSEKYCSLEQLLDAAYDLLKVRGLLFLIYRTDRAGELWGGLAARRLGLERLRMIQPYGDQAANLMLVQARKHGQGQTVIPPPLVVYDSPGCYSREMESIYDGHTVSGGHAHR